MEIHRVQNLLDQVKAINTRYKKINEITGENFNVFRILKLESSEVRMHSAFLAELLNPHGSHGQKDTFLKLFTNTFCFKNRIIDTALCQVKVEEWIGAISDNKMEGGRIDIIITDINSNHIIIENKIYAKDQHYQLTRYHNYSNEADIIYLTLDGKSPAESSKGDLEEGIHYRCYSYEREVLDWLEACRKEVATYPIIREGLTHYINSIKYLTNQTINHNMQEEINNLLKSNLEASFAIYSNLDKACEKVSQDFGRKLIQSFNAIGLICEYNIDFNKRNSSIFIYKSDWKHTSIGFGFENYDKNLVYGFCVDDPKKFPEEYKNQYIAIGKDKSKSSDWWPWYKSFDSPLDNWYNYEAWEAIINGNMENAIIEKVKELLQIAQNFNM